MSCIIYDNISVCPVCGSKPYKQLGNMLYYPCSRYVFWNGSTAFFHGECLLELARISDGGVFKVQKEYLLGVFG